jgi:hypothetical protein
MHISPSRRHREGYHPNHIACRCFDAKGQTMEYRIIPALALALTSLIVASLLGLVPTGSAGASPAVIPANEACTDSLNQACSYWLVAADGGVFSFGTAGFYGSLGGSHLSAPIVGMAPGPGDQGYWLVGADGGVFAFGDAPYFGSLPGDGVHVDNIVGMATSPTGNGYWLVGADGGVFAFGDAEYFGSLPNVGIRPTAQVVGITPTIDGNGYYLAGRDGGVFAFGDAAFDGSFVSQPWQGTPSLVGLSLNFGAPPTAPGYYAVATNGQQAGRGPGQPESSVSPALPIDGPIVSFSATLGVTGSGQVVDISSSPTQDDPGLTGERLSAPVVGVFSFLA